MLITFRSKSSASILMFGDIALQVIEMMGHTRTVPGSIAADGIATALSNLKAAIARHHDAKSSDTKPTDDAEELPEQTIALAKRALPIVQMLEKAKTNNEPILWEQGE
jgi:hypothetical protein